VKRDCGENGIGASHLRECVLRKSVRHRPVRRASVSPRAEAWETKKHIIGGGRSLPVSLLESCHEHREYRQSAGQPGFESTKNSVLDAAKPPEPFARHPSDEGAVILGQIQAMQRSLKEDQECWCISGPGGETLRVHEILFPPNLVLVFAGVDARVMSQGSSPPPAPFSLSAKS